MHAERGQHNMTMPVLPSFDLKRNYGRVAPEIREAVARVLESQHFILGPEVEALEAETAAYLGIANTVGCASGSDALLLAMMALGVGPGDEVITTPFSFFATASCITRLGARPVFADVEINSGNVSAESVRSKITPATRVILPVHLFGQMASVEEIAGMTKGKAIAIVEDCAQAFGASRTIDDQVKRAGSLGTIGCYSFFPTKNLGAYGDAGLVATGDESLAKRLRSLRVHGSGVQYFHDEVGLNSRLDAVQAAILRVRLRHLEEWNEERRLAAERYELLFAEKGLAEFVSAPVETDGNRHIYHQYVVRCSRRDELQRHMQEQGIVTRVYYPLSLHLQPCFSFLGYGEGECPVAEKLTSEVLALPMFPEILPEEQERVADAMKDFYDTRS